MLILIFGPPSGFVQWCLWLIRVMTDVVLIEVDYATASNTDQLRDFWAKRNKPNVLFFADCLNRRLVDVFTQVNAPILILWEKPEDVTAFIMRERNLAFLWSLRLNMQCSMTFADYFLLPRTLVLRRQEQNDIESLLFVVANHFHIALAPEHLAEIERRIRASNGLELGHSVEEAFLASWPTSLPRGVGLEGVPAELTRVGEGLHLRLDALSHGYTFEEMVVERELFIPGSNPQGYLMGPIDMVGPARCIVYGPFLYLPVGDWVADLRFRLLENFSGNVLEVDVFHGGVLVSESFSLPTEGHFSASAHFDVDDPLEAVQLRLILREGAIEGMIDLEEVVLRRAE